MNLTKLALFLTVSLLLASPPSFAASRCIHLGDSQSSASPFAKALQKNFADKDYQVFTYARPSSRTSHWSDVSVANKQGPALTKAKFKFYPTRNSLAPEDEMTKINDIEPVSWAEKVFAHHKKKAPLDCIILQFGDNIDNWKSNQKLLSIVKKMKSETGKCFWVAPTWSEPEKGYSHMSDNKKISIRKEIEKSLQGYDCQLISTTGHGDKVDYSFKDKLKKLGRYTSDGLHLNQAGGKMWADAAFEQIFPALDCPQKHLEKSIKEINKLTDQLASPTSDTCQ